MSNTFTRSLRLESMITAALAIAIVGLLVVLVPSAGATANCPNEQFRTGQGAYLPDCRAYEQVSPQDKNGGEVDGGVVVSHEPAPMQSSPNGEAITFAAQTAFAGIDPLSAPTASQYISRRSPNGWQTTPLDPIMEIPRGKLDENEGALDMSLYQGFSENLESGFLDATNPQPVASAPEGHYNPYLRNTQSGAYTLLAGITPARSTQERANHFEGIIVLYADMSSDGEQVTFAANTALAPGASEGKTNLYEWNKGSVELVSVFPNGEVDEGGLEAPEERYLKFGANDEEKSFAANFDFAGSLSRDGRRAFWTSSYRHLYMHELTATGAKTVDMSASQKTGATPRTPTEEAYAHYWGANTEGTLVYFTSCESLTDDSTATENENPIYYNSRCGAPQPTNFNNYFVGQDLYQYNTVTGKLADVTVDQQPGGADVQGVLGMSDDGSRVYFAAKGVLAEGAREGQNNVYLWDEGKITLVTILEENEEWGERETLIWNQSTNERRSRVSPNGKYLAFSAGEPLTGYPAEPSGSVDCTYQQYNNRCAQVFQYDADTGRLNCVSCNPTGGTPTGHSDVPGTIGNQFKFPGWQTPTDQQRYLSDNGSVFFDSTAGLVPRDTNGAEDVYEYQPAGDGCSEPAGCLSLISSGTSLNPSQFVDADSEASNVFFITNDKLTASDQDELGDLYDARVGGGFSSQVVPPCSGETCRPAITPAPEIYAAPTSQAFSGADNPAAESSPAGTGKKKPAAKSKKKAKKRKRRTRKKRGHRSARRADRHGKRRGK